ncbi:BREX-3 system phosphatase PglZ [Bacillus altitudinis]|uniref:BREX-3 system phosphatase PglZ n=1 Tax=Bacillus altitudinis TaxID=293387 RepID=UPI0024AD73AE|nr:BREX-3 system phosphatase PglZ [Bacillus altitudinis]MDI4571573.1 BREX-3 system phosphatase PglZ [Bacillus altitudinis]
MNGWRKQIVDQIPYSHHSAILLKDVDNLLSDEDIILFLQEKNISLVQVDDRAEFRRIYEDNLNNEKGKWIYRVTGNKEFTFPFDMLQQGYYVELNIHDIMPSFSAQIIRQLDSEVLDALYAVSPQQQGSLSNKDTCNFILKRIYKLAYDLVETVEEWMNLLIQIHDSRYPLAPILKDYIKKTIERKGISKERLLLIESKGIFYQYLQGQWEEFVKQIINNDLSVKDGYLDTDTYHKEHFMHSEQIHRAIQHLFIEGRLQAVEIDIERNIPLCAQNGVKQRSYNPLKDIEFLVDKVISKLSIERKHNKEWIEIIDTYSQIKDLQLHYNTEKETVDSLTSQIEAQFKEWILTDYKALAGLSPYIKPAMVHHILPHLQLKDEKKQALIIMDGMSFIQWKQIKRTLESNFTFEEYGVFAWVPTITEISRMSIFQATIPRLQESIKEEKAWKQFWNKESISDMHITFENILAQGGFDSKELSALEKSNNKKAAIILRNIDKLTHGAIQGLEGMYAEIDVWLKTNYLQDLLSHLKESGYSTYITSDHGNKESVGIGKVKQGSLVETKGERARIYSDLVFRDDAAAQYSSVKWPNYGFSDDQHFLVAESGEAFVTKGQHIVSHGGISIEEVIVPFIKVY